MKGRPDLRHTGGRSWLGQREKSSVLNAFRSCQQPIQILSSAYLDPYYILEEVFSKGFEPTYLDAVYFCRQKPELWWRTLTPSRHDSLGRQSVYTSCKIRSWCERTHSQTKYRRLTELGQGLLHSPFSIKSQRSLHNSIRSDTCFVTKLSCPFTWVS